MWIMVNNLSDKIAEATNEPRNISQGDMSVGNHSIPDLIAADKHLAQKEAIQSRTMGLRLGKFKPPEHF
jgi:hypothetical protein